MKASIGQFGWLKTIDLSIDRSLPIARYGGRHDPQHLIGLAHPNEASYFCTDPKLKSEAIYEKRYCDVQCLR